MALVPLKDIPLPASTAPPPSTLAAIRRPETRGGGGATPLSNAMRDNELLVFINETQLIGYEKGGQMRRRTRKNGDGE